MVGKSVGNIVGEPVIGLAVGILDGVPVVGAEVDVIISTGTLVGALTV